MKAIVAVDRNWGIGKDGDLLVHLSRDLKYFKENTIGGTIVIGRKTLESFPGARPLPGRTNIVLTRDPSYEAEGCVICRPDGDETTAERLGEIIEELGLDTDRVFVCGGGSVYRQLLTACDEVLVTKIEDVFEADTFFPDLDAAGKTEDEVCPDASGDIGMWKKTWESEPVEENGVTFRFTKYERV